MARARTSRRPRPRWPSHHARGESAIRVLLVVRTRSIAAVVACIFERAQWRRALNGRPAPRLTKVANIITRTSHYERLTASSAGYYTQRGGSAGSGRRAGLAPRPQHRLLAGPCRPRAVPAFSRAREYIVGVAFVCCNALLFCVLFIQRGREKSAKGAYLEIRSSSKH